MTLTHAILTSQEEVPRFGRGSPYSARGHVLASEIGALDRRSRLERYPEALFEESSYGQA
jgi:hypothetical protein